ncbi:MAG: DUF1631 domain-containing protein [Spongiibacteraceae bacterium]|jgi:hypothetical protein|nr:DUF1631 domain-containing protein [Spongiibacteraceae bacterium]
MTSNNDNMRPLSGGSNNGKDGKGGRSATPLPSLLNQVKEHAVSALDHELERLFASCDDLFFDLSSRASSNAEQNLYFESMREVRIMRAGVAKRFHQELESVFHAAVAGKLKSRNATSPEVDVSAEHLSLVQHDDLEREVAIAGMVNKANAVYQEQLYALTTRLNVVADKAGLSLSDNPLAPEHLCASFANACDTLDVSIKARIIIYKQFDRLVIGQLGRLYNSANTLLVSAGILPKIRHQISKSESATAPASGGAEANRAADAVSELGDGMSFDLAELGALLAAVRSTDTARIPNYVAYAANPGPEMPRTELLQQLHALQAARRASDENAHNASIIRALVQQILSSRSPEQPNALKQSDEDIINLVAMFFDFVLDDRNLPVAVQALISRLQIPVLKAALKDKTFFSNGHHPARRLINTLAQGAIGWEDATEVTRDALYKAMSRAAQQVLDDYADDENVFASALYPLERALEQQAKRASLIERRTNQAAEGEARTKLARSAAQAVLFEKLQKAALPSTISRFLSEDWLNALILVHLRHGEDSAQWVESCQLVDDLVWACKRHSDSRSTARLEKIKPALLERIDHALIDVINAEETRVAIIQELSTVLDQVQTDALPQDEFKPITVQQAINLGHRPGAGTKSWKDMTALERQQAQYQELVYEFIKKVEETPTGTWVKYQVDSSGKTLTCKLSSHVSASDSYLFVNRLGFKVLEKGRKDFAYDMQRGRVQVIERGLLFDRVMNRIVGNMRNDRYAGATR